MEQSSDILRCRRCRHQLLARKSNNDVNACCKTFAPLEPIVDQIDADNCETPGWLLTALNENEWRKGKFCCPWCKAKVGSFNFVTPQLCACGLRRTPPMYLYKSKIDVCSSSVAPTRGETSSRGTSFHGDAGTPSSPNRPARDCHPMASSFGGRSGSRSHRKSQSWHAPSSVVSSWLATTFAEVSSHLDVAVAETKHVLAGTLNFAETAVAAPVSSAIRKGHRKTRSWSGSIKTALSSLIGGLFPDSTGVQAANSTSTASYGEAHDTIATPHVLLPEKELEIMCSTNETCEEDSDSSLRCLAGANGTSFGALSSRGDNIVNEFCGTKDKHDTPASSSGADIPKSASASSIIPDYLLCSICLDLLCLPRYCLPCRHAFCEPCLKMLTHNQHTVRNRLRILCPLCRQIIRWTEPGTDLLADLITPEFASRYGKRVLDYHQQSPLHSFVLPGLYQLKFIWQIIGCLPEPIAHHLETLWVDYTPLVTLYSFFVSVLCLLFFFILFLPGVYFTACIWKAIQNLSLASVNEFSAAVIYQEALEFSALVAGSGMISIVSIVVVTSIAVYTLFVM